MIENKLKLPMRITDKTTEEKIEKLAQLHFQVNVIQARAHHDHKCQLKYYPYAEFYKMQNYIIKPSTKAMYIPNFRENREKSTTRGVQCHKLTQFIP